MEKDEFSGWHRGQTIWVPHPDVGYTKATILNLNPSTKTLNVRLDEFEKIVDVPSSDCDSITTDKDTILLTEDLTKLPDLHRPALLDALSQRFKANKIYTYTGHILIALNPYVDLGLYSKEIMKPFINNRIFGGEHLKPHVYNISNNAFLSMLDNTGLNQSILVSGESGSGKTVSTKIMLDYLTTVSQVRSNSVGDAQSAAICDKVIQSNPLLEAFGNALTLRNDNSSRFGKLIQLQFDVGKSRLLGARIDTYLLEKARVMHHAPGERNFHIFYELFRGAPDSEKRELQIPHIEDARITNAHDRRILRSDVNDNVQYSATIKAMRTVGLSEEEILTLKKLVVAIMHIGEIFFSEVEASAEEACEVTNGSKPNLEAACRLLEITTDNFESALLSRQINVIKGKPLTKAHNVQQALEARNALAMALYERTFLWLVWKINQSLKFEAQDKKYVKKVGNYFHDHSIAVLDIFGFEVFEHNGFEQLFTNYTNEVLQQLFNEFVFKLEQQIYQSENIDWTKITFPDNFATIEMIEDKRFGLLKLLDDECLYPKGNDKSLHDKIATMMNGKFSTISVDERLQKGHMLFSISHFAGKVEYATSEFCLKNKNELRQEQVSCVKSSSSEFVSDLLPEDVSMASGAISQEYFDTVFENKSKRKANPTNNNTVKSLFSSLTTQKLQQSTVGNNFKIELKNAIDKIKASQLHFVRCIKPNNHNLAMDFDRKHVLEQLDYGGVLEAIRISRLGYSSRFLFIDFVERFRSLAEDRVLDKKTMKSKQNKDFKTIAEVILAVNKLIKFDEYQLGVSKVFLKSEAFQKLEGRKREKLYDSAALLQRNIKIYLFKLKLAFRIEEKRRKAEEERRKLLALEQKSNPNKNVKKNSLSNISAEKSSKTNIVDIGFDNSFFDISDDVKSVEELPATFEEVDIMSEAESMKNNQKNITINFKEVLEPFLSAVDKVRSIEVDFENLSLDMNMFTEQDLIILGVVSSVVVFGLANVLFFIGVKMFINLLVIAGFLSIAFFVIYEVKVKNDKLAAQRYKVVKLDHVLNKVDEADSASEVAGLSDFEFNKKPIKKKGSRNSTKSNSKKNQFKIVKTQSKKKASLSGKGTAKKKNKKTEELTSAERIQLQQTFKRTKSFNQKHKSGTLNNSSSKRFTGIVGSRPRNNSEGSLSSGFTDGTKMNTLKSAKDKKTLTRKSSKFEGINYKYPNQQ